MGGPTHTEGPQALRSQTVPTCPRPYYEASSDLHEDPNTETKGTPRLRHIRTASNPDTHTKPGTLNRRTWHSLIDPDPVAHKPRQDLQD